MRVIEITEKKRDKMAEYAEKMLRYGGKLMQCLDALDEESEMGHRDDDSYRGRMGNRYPMGRRYGGDMGEREDWDDDDDYEMGERRGRNSRGRYTHR